jgi:hypothetical protein
MALAAFRTGASLSNPKNGHAPCYPIRALTILRNKTLPMRTMARITVSKLV